MNDVLHKFNGISRFELTPNTTLTSTEQAYSIYGILIIPELLGGLLLYHAFELRGTLFWVAIGMITVILVNIYVVYKRLIQREHLLKLIIDDAYIQIIQHRKIQFQAHIRDVQGELIQCGMQGYSAIKISSEELPYLIIGIKEPLPKQSKTQLFTQPDYWLNNSKEWKHLSEQLKGNQSSKSNKRTPIKNIGYTKSNTSNVFI